MSILDITVVTVALPTFQREFDATAAEVAWTMTGYTAGAGHGHPADRLGGRPVRHQAALPARGALFTAGSVLCATADQPGDADRASGCFRASAAAC